jgi:hypothetical protein
MTAAPFGVFWIEMRDVSKKGTPCDKKRNRVKK